MWNLKNKINKQTKLEQTRRHRERSGGCQRGTALGAQSERGEGTKTHQLAVTK